MSIAVQVEGEMREEKKQYFFCFPRAWLFKLNNGIKNIRLRWSESERRRRLVLLASPLWKNCFCEWLLSARKFQTSERKVFLFFSIQIIVSRAVKRSSDPYHTHANCNIESHWVKSDAKMKLKQINELKSIARFVNGLFGSKIDGNDELNGSFCEKC